MKFSIGKENEALRVSIYKFAQKEIAPIADKIDNDFDSDDYVDLNGNGFPDYVDENNNNQYDLGEQIEPGVKWLGGNNFYIYANGLDDDKDGKIDENIDEGIDEASEDNRYTVNEFGFYYQLNWKLNQKLELIILVMS